MNSIRYKMYTIFINSEIIKASGRYKLALNLANKKIQEK